MISFNGTVMPWLYIDVSEMSIVGPPPRTPGGRFFLLKRKRARHDELGEGFAGTHLWVRALGLTHCLKSLGELPTGQAVA